MPVDLIDLTSDLKDLAQLAADPDSVDDLLVRALDSLKSIVPYDLAAVLELQRDEDQLRVRKALGPLANDKVRNHSISLRDFPSIRQAMERRVPQILEEHDHRDGEGDPYDGVLDLEHGHSCMVVPLFAGDRTLGAMTFDRIECRPYPQGTAELAGIYGQIVSLAIAEAEKSELLDRYRQQLQEQNRLLQEEVAGPSAAGALLKNSQDSAMQRVVRLSEQVAGTDAPVLILGETGTGKEVLAAAIHEWSKRGQKPFVKINCAALPEALLESELFGHKKGAFSGAAEDRPGRFAVANGGTLLLDEIGELPLEAQAKLLRVLQEGTYEPVGSDSSVRVDVRILAATHVSLEAAIEQGRFREDLYYRLNVFPIDLPPLRERGLDILLIAQQILAQLQKQTGRGPWRLSPASERRLRSHDWPGNVRELRNCLERATILQHLGELDVELSPRRRGAKQQSSAHDSASQPPDGLWLTMDEMQRQYIERVLEKTQGKVYGQGGAAELLGMKPTTLQSRMKKLGISRPG